MADQRSLLEVTAVFADGWTIPAAAQVAGLDEDRALELSEALARHSLVYIDGTELGPRDDQPHVPRIADLITVQQILQRLLVRPVIGNIGPARHGPVVEPRRVHGLRP